MAQERLYIGGQYIPLQGSLNPSITKSLTDLTEPDKRKSTHTKTVVIPRSKEADKVFEQMFEVNIIDRTFNFGSRADCRYEVDCEEIIKGYIKLNELIELNNNDIAYGCALYGTTSDFFANIKDKYLVDLYGSVGSYEGLDIYDHSFTKEIQQLSWEDEIIINGSLEPFAFGQGYVYPLIDYGLSSDSTNFIYTQMPCAIYENEYMRRIISYAGFTLQTGGWMDTDDVINHLIIPSSPEIYQLDSDDIEDREFAANTPEFTSTGTTTSNNLPTNGSYSSPDIIIFTNEIVDTGLNYNPATGEFTVVSAGVYDLTSILEINATFTPSTATAVKTICDIHGKVQFWYTPNGGSEVLTDEIPFYITSDDVSFTSGARSTSSTPTYPDSDYMNGKAWGKTNATTPIPRNVNPPDRYQLTSNAIPLNAGDVVTVKVTAGVFTESTNSVVYIPNGFMFIDALNTKYGGNATLTISVGSFYNKVNNTSLTEGNTLTMDKVIPNNIKMIDYFMWNVKRFNLIVDVNPLNPKELIIKTRDNYLTSDVLNIHELIDISKEVKHLPITSIDITKYLYTYKPDKDYYNDKYTTSWQEVYGQRQVDVDVPFSATEYKTEIGFSPTCMVAPPNEDRVLPTIYQLTDTGQPKPVQHNIRSLYYVGLKPCTNAWNHINYTNIFAIPLVDTFTEYPYAGHWDDPYNPTLDINFGLVKEVFYDDNINDIVTTDNNLVNKYYSKQLRELTDVDSRIIEAFVHLRPAKFTDFTFDKLYYFNYAYFRLQEIQGYNPNAENTTKCIFLKLKDVPTFTPTTRPADGTNQPFNPDYGGNDSGGNVDMEERLPTKGVKSQYTGDNNNYSNKTHKVSGQNNYINSTAKNVEIYGDYNSVYGGTDNIKIHGSNNVIEAGVSNVVLINTSGLTVTESNVTYINGLIVNNVVEYIDTNTTASKYVRSYYVDASSGTVDLTFNITSTDFEEGQLYFIKAIDITNTNRVRISGGTIDGAASYTFSEVNEAIEIQFHTDNFYIVSNKNTGGSGSGLTQQQVEGLI